MRQQTIIWMLVLVLLSYMSRCEGGSKDLTNLVAPDLVKCGCQRPTYVAKTLSEILKDIGIVDSYNYKITKTENYIYYVNFEFEHTVIYHLREPHAFANTGSDEAVYFLYCELRGGKPYMWSAFIVPLDGDSYIRKLFIMME